MSSFDPETLGPVGTYLDDVFYVRGASVAVHTTQQSKKASTKPTLSALAHPDTTYTDNHHADAACTTANSTATQPTRTLLRMKRGKERSGHPNRFLGVTLPDSPVHPDGFMAKTDDVIPDEFTVRTDTKDSRGANNRVKAEICVSLSDSAESPERADDSVILRTQSCDESRTEIHESFSFVKDEKKHHFPLIPSLGDLSSFRVERPDFLLAEWIPHSSTRCPPQANPIFTRRSDALKIFENSRNHSEESDLKRSSVGRDELKNPFDGITDSTVKGAIWKLARDELRSNSKVQNSVKDSDSDVQNNLMDLQLSSENVVQNRSNNRKGMSLHEEPTEGLSKREHGDLSLRSAMDSKTVQKIAMDRSNSLPNFLVFCRSLVRREFLSLESVVKAAARRDNDKAVKITNTCAALWLDSYEKTKALDLQREAVRSSSSWLALENLDVSKADYKRHCF